MIITVLYGRRVNQKTLESTMETPIKLSSISLDSSGVLVIGGRGNLDLFHLSNYPFGPRIQEIEWSNLKKGRFEVIGTLPKSETAGDDYYSVALNNKKVLLIRPDGMVRLLNTE